jgi:hypothetical protein
LGGEAALAGRQLTLPEEKFGVLYADPPWRWQAWAGVR